MIGGIRSTLCSFHYSCRVKLWWICFLAQEVKAVITHSIHSVLHSLGGVQVMDRLFVCVCVCLYFGTGIGCGVGGQNSSVGSSTYSWLEGHRFNPQKERQENFLSRVDFLCWLLLGVCSTPLLPQWHIKDPSYSAKSAGNNLHLNMHTSLTQWSQSGLTAIQT